MSLWLNARKVPPGPVELVAVLVNHTGVEATFGVAATVDRWEDGTWVAHRQFLMCLDHWWHCTTEMESPGSEMEAPAVGLSATRDQVGPVERFSIDGLEAGWYRVNQEANEGVVASGVIEVADGATPPAPLVPLDAPAISVTPPVVAPSSAVEVTLSPRIPAPSGSQTIGEVEHAVEALSESAVVQRWDGAGWEPVADVALTPPGSQTSALDRSAELPELPDGEYRLVRTGSAGDHVGRFWVASTDESPGRQAPETSVDDTEDAPQAPVPAGWTAVNYGEVTFSVPPGWVEQDDRSCDTRTDVRGYYLVPPRRIQEGRSGCASPEEHWDTRDTVTLFLTPAELRPLPSAESVPFTTDSGLESVRWENGVRLVEYWFPGPRLAVSAYHSLDPVVHPEEVVKTISIASQPSPDPGAATLDRVSVKLYHCGIDPLHYDGRTWEVPRDEQPFDATNAPAAFTGSGTVERLSEDELVYVDDSGIQLPFVPEDSVPPPPCG